MAPKLVTKIDQHLNNTLNSTLDQIFLGLVRGRILNNIMSCILLKIFSLFSDNVLLDLLNDPVHILDDDENLSPSAFIPFCSFQGSSDLLGKDYGNFSLPVCSSFKKRILDGKLCYQIDVNSIITETSAAELQKGGLSLLVDANAEYDLIKLLRNNPKEEIFDDFTEEFFEAEESEKIMIHIETISKTNVLFFLH